MTPTNQPAWARALAAFCARCITDALLIVIALVLFRIPLPPSWIEHGYANGIYASLATTFVPLSNHVPFAVGDLELALVLVGLIVWWVRSIRRARGARWRAAALMIIHTAGVVAAIGIWFQCDWGLNYRRAPIVERVAFDGSHVNAASVAAFSKAIVSDLIRTAPLAHARMNESPADMRAHLAVAFAPVVARLGDTYAVDVTTPKTTLFDRWYEIAGIGGMFNPFSYETNLNANFLPFESPFALAHEWGHVAGFGDESDANLIGALTCLRSDDPLIHYSGLFWIYDYLPESERQRLPVSKLVYNDLVAARERFLRHYNPNVFFWQWFVYDKYLRANRVRSGVVSYSLFVEVLVGTPRDAEGLPASREPAFGKS
jgi:hypothetical protein